MSVLLIEAERIKLSRLLHVAPESLTFLDGLGTDGLRELRERASAALFDEYRPMFQRIANSGRIFPATLIAFLSQKVFGPWISARTAGLMAIDKAVDVSKKLPVAFQADMCLLLDPRSTRELIRRLPVQIIVDVSRVMMQRKEYITMARFVDCLTDEAIRAVAQANRDDDAIIMIGFYVESGHALSESMELLPPERIRSIIQRTIEGPPMIQHAGLAMLSKVTDPIKGLLGDAAAALGDAPLRTLFARLAEQADKEVLAGALAHMSADARGRVEKMFAF